MKTDADCKNTQSVVKSSRREHSFGFHSTCFVCGPDNTDGIRLSVQQIGNEAVGNVIIDARFQGYDGVVHGGVVASILDAAMVRCLHNLFGKDPFTCKLDTRYYRETPTGQRLIVTARLKSRRGPMCWVEGGLFSGHTRCAKALGVFKLGEDE